MDNDKLDTLKVNTGWINIEIVSESDAQLTFKGYAPIIKVKVEKSGLVKMLYISAKSLAEKLEPLRQDNKGRFTGLRLKIRKESEDRFASYLVEKVES